jgi:hypothetical protein
MGRRALKELARRMVVVEKARLEGMRRAVRGLGLGIEKVGDVALDTVSIGDAAPGVRVEYANPIPRDEDERGEVVKGSGDTEGEEGGPADEVVMDAFLGEEEEMEGAGAADEAQQPADATQHVDSAEQPRSDEQE